MTGLSTFRIGILLAALALGIGIAYGAYVVVTDASKGTAMSEGEQLIRVSKGDLVNDVSVSGTLAFPVQDTLAFGTDGKVAQVLIKEGQPVIEDQLLASLDGETIATLNKAVAQARISVRDAEEALTEAQSPVTDLELAIAEANVADARVAHEASLNALTEAQSPVTDLKLALAEANVADARIAHEASLNVLARLLHPSTQRLADAESTVADARVSLAAAKESLKVITALDPEVVARADVAVVAANIAANDAREALAEVLNGPSDDDITKIRLKVDSASTTLANAHRDEKIAVSKWNGEIILADNLLATAVENYTAAFLTWFGITLGQEEQYRDPDILLGAFGIDLHSLFGPDSPYYGNGQRINTGGLAEDDPDTAWNEASIYIWLNLYPGTIYPTCPHSNIVVRTPCIRQELDNGWELVQQALDASETTSMSAAKAVTTAEIFVANSEDKLSEALEQLEDLNKAPDPLQIQSLEKNIVLAEAVLDSAQEDLTSLASSPPKIDVDAEKAKVVLAEAILDTAQEDLAVLISDPTKIDVDAENAKVALAEIYASEAQKDLAELRKGLDPVALVALEKQVAVDREKLNAAEENLTELRKNADPFLIALRQTSLTQAQASLEAALEALDFGILSAPQDGVISTVNIEAGQHISRAVSAIEIYDPTVVEVDGAVDEIDVLYLREGAPASITMDALPGQVLAGSISKIDAQSTNQQGVVTYQISIRVETAGLQLLEGLTAVASVILREDNDVLLVPLDALYGSFDNPIVRVSMNSQIEERPVKLGNTDDFWAVVTSGVSEGDLVVMKSQQAETTFGFGRFDRGFGANFRGRPGSGGQSPR